MNKKLFFITTFVLSGLLFSQAGFSQEPEEPSVAVEADVADDPVEIEAPIVHTREKLCHCSSSVLLPYTKRRTRFGGTFGAQWGTFTPSNYVTLNRQTFDSYYAPQKNSSIEIAFSAKWNFTLGSIGPHITAGYFSASHDVKDTSGATSSTSTLSIYPITAGVIYAMDNIFNEPYVVPYVIGGLYTGIYNESQEGLGQKGNTAFAPYYSVGLMFQMDWIDKEAHDSAYEDFGIENTFLFVEGRSFMQATTASSSSIPDISTPLQLFAGLKTEF